MRQLTSISGKSSAEAFVAYLVTQDISTHVEPDTTEADKWDIWIRDEDKTEFAREAHQQFLQSPNDPKFRQAVDQARSILKEQKQKSIERRKNIQNPVSRVNPSLFSGRLPPLTLTLVLICVFFGVVKFLLSDGIQSGGLGSLAMQKLGFVDLKLYLMSGDPAASLKRGELWRVLTPAFLHGDPLHLLLNMLALANLGRVTERLEGTGKYALIVLFVAICSHLLQGLTPTQWYGSPNFVGISGVIMGLLGYLGIKTTLRPDLGFVLPPQAYIMTGLILVLGFSQGMNLANLAHLGGLVAGIAIGFVLSDRRFDRK